MLSKKGRFIISLDYEQYWGGFSNSDIEEYVKSNIVHVHSVFDKTLDLFSKYDVFCTIAIVGLLFLDSLEELGECKKFNIDYKLNGNTLTISKTLNYLDQEVSPEEYKATKTFYQNVVEAQNQQIALEKI